MKFNLYGRDFIVPRERSAYNDIRQVFSQLAEEAVDSFYDIYMEENANLEDVYENIDRQGKRVLNRLINESMDIFTIKGVDQLDREDFLREYRNSLRYSFWDDAKNQVKEEYIRIELGREELEEYRRRRKESRGKLEEERLNIEEIKGQREPDKEAGFGKKLLNMVGNSVSKGISTIEKQSVFKNQETLESLLEGIYNSAYFMHYSLIEVLEELTGEEYSWVSKVKENQVEERLVEIKGQDLSDGDKLDALIDMLEKDPYNQEVYQYAFDQFKDPEGELDRVARFFGVDLQGYKEEHLWEYFRQIDLDLDHEERESSVVMPKRFMGLMKADREEQREQGYIWKPLRISLVELSRLYIIKYQLMRYSEEIHLDLDNKVIRKMEDLTLEFLDDFRMVNGVFYDSLDEAFEARQERERIENIMRNLQVSEEGILAAIREIEENCKLDLKLDYIDRLYEDLDIYVNEKIKSQIEGKDFKSVEDIEKMIDQIKMDYKGYDVVDEYEDFLLDEIDNFLDREIGRIIKESQLDTIEDYEEMIGFIDDSYENKVKNRHINRLENEIVLLKGKEKLGQVVDRGKDMVKGLLNGIAGKEKKDDVRVISSKEEAGEEEEAPEVIEEEVQEEIKDE